MCSLHKREPGCTSRPQLRIGPPRLAFARLAIAKSSSVPGHMHQYKSPKAQGRARRRRAAFPARRCGARIRSASVYGGKPINLIENMESPGCRSGSLKFCTIGLAVVVTDAGPWGDKDGNEDDRDRPHDLRLMI